MSTQGTAQLPCALSRTRVHTLPVGEMGAAELRGQRHTSSCPKFLLRAHIWAYPRARQIHLTSLAVRGVFGVDMRLREGRTTPLPDPIATRIVLEVDGVLATRDTPVHEAEVRQGDRGSVP